MRKKELISIIVPIYNTQNFLNKCVDSILNQTYRELEIILVDDGSTDESGKICDKYKLIDNRVKVIHKKNGGVSMARNYGLKMINGEYVIFIDSDDWLENNMIETLYNNMIKYKVDISICNFEIDCKDGKKIITHKEEDLITRDIRDKYENLFAKDGFGGYLWNKLIKTEVVKNIFFNENIKIEEDVLFLIEVFQKCESIYYNADNILYHYVVRDNSAVRFSYSIKDITKIKSLEEKLKLKEKYNLKSLEKVEFEYVTLLNQSIYIMKKEKINNKEFYNKRKNGNKKYLKKAFKEAIGMQKIKLLMLVFQPNLYGKIVEHRWRF